MRSPKARVRYIQLLALSVTLFSTPVANALDIQGLILREQDLPDGFYLQSEKFNITGKTPGERVYQEWRRKGAEKKIVLVEEKVSKTSESTTEYMQKKWYRVHKGKKKDIIEIKVFITPSVKAANELVRAMSKMYASPMELLKEPVVGEKTWVYPMQRSSWALVFTRNRVVVRLWASIEDTSQIDCERMLKGLAKKIDAKLAPHKQYKTQSQTATIDSNNK